MSKKGLPPSLKMRHDSHYVEELTKSHQFIGRVIPISKIEPNPEQPRVEMGDLTELVESIREKGVLEPLLVKPLEGLERWLIIAGERRWRASQLAGLKELPCVEMNVSEQEIAEIALIENLQRKDLTVWEEADAYMALCQRFNHTHEDLARRLGKSRSSVTETLTIANLPTAVKQKCIEFGISSKTSILKIARKFDEAEMLEEIEKILRQTGSKNFATEPETNDSEKNTELNLFYINPMEPIVLSKDSGRVDEQLQKTNKFPSRIFKFKDAELNFQFELRFKKPADKNDLKKAIDKIAVKFKEFE